MMHIVIDTSIYRTDPKRSKSAFRALARLSRGRKVQLHVPHYVKQEFLTQQVSAIAETINSIQTKANAILRTTNHEELLAYAETTKRSATEILNDAATFAADEFKEWLTESHAIEHPVKPEHGQRVTDDYFSGARPFTSAKHRQDIPDSFIWQTILDLARKHATLYVIAHDGAVHDSASKSEHMIAYKTLEDFIQAADCQKALTALTDETVAANIDRAKALLHRHRGQLAHMVELDLVNALQGRTVHHSSIPDDNNEAMILSVGSPDDLTFDFQNVEYYGANELGVSFEAAVECTVNYAIYKGDYYTMSENKTERISISERNEHYFDADENYDVEVKGVLSITLKVERLQDNDLTDDDVSDVFDDADYDIEILETTVTVPYHDLE